MSEKIVQLNEEIIKEQLKELVRGSVDESLEIAVFAVILSISKLYFRNEVFATLEKVVDCLCDTICSLTPNTIFSITGRDWIIKAFN